MNEIDNMNEKNPLQLVKTKIMQGHVLIGYILIFLVRLSHLHTTIVQRS